MGRCICAAPYLFYNGYHKPKKGDIGKSRKLRFHSVAKTGIMWYNIYKDFGADCTENNNKRRDIYAFE